MAGRDEEIENYTVAIQALGKVGIPMVCYNWMVGLGWYRTKVDVPDRGGALLSEFDNNDAKNQGLTQWGEVPEEKIWTCRATDSCDGHTLHKVFVENSLWKSTENFDVL